MGTKTVAVNINVNAEQGAKSLKELKDEFSALNKSISGLDENSEAYLHTLQQIAGVKDDIEGLNKSIAAQTGGGKIQALANVGTQIAAGFSLAQGAMALFGSESQEVEKALLKVQAAQAVLAGFKELEGLAGTFKNAGLAVKSLLSDIGLLTAAQKIYNFIASINPYVLMVAGAAALTAAIYGLVKAFETEETQATRLNKLYEARKKANDELEKSLQNEITALEGLNENEGKIIEKKRELIRLQIQEAKLRVLATAETEKQAMKETSFLEEITAKTVKLFGVTKNEADFKKIRNEDEIKNKKEAVDELNKLLAEQQKFENELNQKSDDKNKELAQKAKELRDKLYQEEIEQRIRNRQEKKDEQSAREAELQSLADADNEEALRKQHIRDLEIEAEKEKNAAIIQESLNRYEAEKKLSDDKRIQDERNKQFAVDNYAQTFQTIGDLFNAFAGKSEEAQRRAFNVNKATSIAEATISTILAAQKAYASQMSLPDPSAPIRAAVAASLAIAAGVARVAAIARTEFKSSGSIGSISSGSGNGGDFNPSLSSPVSNTSTLISDISNPEKKANPIKVFVTETDISNSQNNINKIIQKASIE